MPRERKYRVKLTDEQVKRLKKVMRDKATTLTVRNRCQILLDMDEAHGKQYFEEQCAKRCAVHIATVSYTVKKFAEEGLDACLVLKRSVNSDNARRKVDGRAEAQLIALACGPVPEGYARWTLRLLEEKAKVILDAPVSHDTIRRTLKKNELRPHRNDYWCLPKKEDPEFVARMEDVFDIYERPYDALHPVVCMDEKPYQLLGEARGPLPMRPGGNRKVDSEYVRNGTCSIFAFTQPLKGVRHVSVREHRTATDWAEEIKTMVDEWYPDAEKITLVMDNLNTHEPASLYKRFPAPGARRILKKLDIHYIPKHGSWLDMAEIELNVMTRQCLSRRIADIETLKRELSSWESNRNSTDSKIVWQFQTKDVRVKLASLYPKIVEC